MQPFLTIFTIVFLAELGDKTQIAALLFAADSGRHPLVVFFAASLALVASTAIAVALGSAAERYANFIPLKLLAGVGFILVGILSISAHFRNA